MTDAAPNDEASNVPSSANAEAPPLDFGVIVSRELTYVWNSLRRLGVHPNDLKDQSQEVFFTVHHLLGDYDPSRPLRPWLFAIAYRVAGRYRYKRAREPLPLDEGMDPADGSPNAEAQLAARQDRALVMKAIQSIPIDRRAVFLLSEIDEVPAPGIAESLGIPLNTVYSRLRVARAEFASAVLRQRSKEHA